jgi:DNA-binding Xre family transcriptional regulator
MSPTPIKITQDLRDLIRLTRTDVAGLSQRQAALAAGDMSTVWWRTIETGRADTVPADTVARMCYAIDVSPGQLRSIGEDVVAGLVERRHALLQPEILLQSSDAAEQHLWRTPEVTPDDRVALITYLRTLRQVRSA